MRKLTTEESVTEYQESIQRLNQRISEIKNDKKLFDVEDRICPLVQMRNELLEVKREVKYYYERSWWRNEKLTCNQRKSRKFIYSGPAG